MNKRGIGLSFEALVVAILVLIVLAVIVTIFLTQTGKYVGKYSDVAGEAEKQAKGCSILFGRYCDTNCGNDRDLGKSDECASDQVCCEKS